MIVLTHEDVAALLPMREAIEVIDAVMRRVSAREVELPLRSVLPVGGGNRMGVMPGAIADPACFGVKLISLFPGNADRGLSSHRGAMVLFEAETGGAIAMMDASLLTAVRTAAASAVATRALASETAETLTLIGYGEQAEHHLAAMLSVRPSIGRVLVAGRSAEKAAAFAARAAGEYSEVDFASGTDLKHAVEQADILCTVTAAAQPIVMGDWVKPGAHVNIVGSSIPSMREVDDRMVHRGAIWVDYLPSTLAQAGEIVDMIAAGHFSERDIRGEIGALLSGGIAGRGSKDEITIYRSLGVAAQDLAAAHHVYDRALELDMGQHVTF
ncbi:ornithine cyclodeaminase family protein [Pseudodonghicola flavimaris]|uniref:Ornithine cyclodeaminase family protein n=1 Tax=Pseudodonghicola flavimaris TaxID=3050036 RepID=A0ABT7EXM0_9RHOB|nr:ornithine cyclodeaminase family protein [Pseudodonghicola flavimaris]MDK3017095.1 ornithine cyclodeaminase family protein [Pseudodonghicola flavimaris]